MKRIADYGLQVNDIPKPETRNLMLQHFLTYIQKEKLFDSSDRLLLAVSGGLDSMVMLHLFQKTGYSFSVAHCNFQLRGEESDGDEKFVVDYCDQHNIRLFTQRFDTSGYALQEGISIEMAARDLRYNWFYELMGQYQFDLLATAHHQDDLIETFFINLGRGTGIRGLSGIKPKAEKLIRPMLFTNRKEIAGYASAHQIDYREDSSNSDTDIKRNFIRHKIVPMFQEYQPSYLKNVVKTATHLAETEQLFQVKIDEIRKKLLRENEEGTVIHIESLKSHQPVGTVLFELLKDFSFTPEVVDEIVGALDGIPGKKFYSPTHRLIKDREKLILSELERPEKQTVYIEEDCSDTEIPIRMSFVQIEKTPGFRFSTNPKVADFDLDKLEFPLILRKWKEGEYFQPLGMTGYKKISDFFIDEKFSIPEKENTWILASGDKVVWIVGQRMDNRFKMDAGTKNILRISVEL